MPADLREELHALAQALRLHLTQLREGGAHSVPVPPQRPRPAAQAVAARPQAPKAPGMPEPRSRERPPEDLHTRPGPPPEVHARPSEADLPARPGPPAAVPGRPEAAARSAPAPIVRPSPRPQEHRGLPDPLPVLGADGLALVRDVLGPCQRCQLCHGRNELVFGQGHPEPLVVFVGEGPGAEEDRTGLPFVGAAGDLLTQMIGAMGNEAKKRGDAELAARLRRDQVYICNVVKCRPPGNRTPEPDEMAACAPFLRGQIQALRPRILVALGRTPAQHLLRTAAPISKLRGTWQSYEGIPLMPTFHPAYLLRTPSAKRQAWDDLQAVITRLQELRASDAQPAR